MNFRWSNICVLQFLLVLHANALKLVPAQRTIVRTNGSTRTISKYYLLPQDDDDPFDPKGSAPSSDNEDFAEFLREFRAKKVAEQNPKKKVDKYKIYIKRKLKHKAPVKPPNILETTTEDLKLPVTTEKYKIPIKITEYFKLPDTTTEIISEASKLPVTITEANIPTDATFKSAVTEITAIPINSETTANPVTNYPSQAEGATTTEQPITDFTTIITTIHHPDKPSTKTEAYYGQTPNNTLGQTPEYGEENGDKPKDLIPHAYIFDSIKAQRGNQSEGPRPENVIKHIETDGFVEDLTKIGSDEDSDVNKTAADTDKHESNNTSNNENTPGIQPPYKDSKENKTKLDEEFQKLLDLLKESTKDIPGYNTQNWEPYNAQTPINLDGIMLLDDPLKTSPLKIPAQLNHYIPKFIDSYETTTVTSLEPENGSNYPLKLHSLWSLLVTDEQNSSHQQQVNTTYVHEHSNSFSAGLHSAKIQKNITSALSNSGYTQLPNAVYSEAPHNTDYNKSETTTPIYTDNTQPEFPEAEASTVFTDYTKSGHMDFGQNETNSSNADNTQSQNQSNPFYTDYTQFANADSSQAGSYSDFTGYAESTNNDYLHTGTDAVNMEHTQSEYVKHLTNLNPHYGDAHSGNTDLSQVGINTGYMGNTQSGSNDFSQTASNLQHADYTQPANTDFSNYAAMQSENTHYFQNQPHPQYADYTQTLYTGFSQTGSNSTIMDYSESANFDVSQTQSNSNYADYAQAANTDFAQTGSNVDYTGYTQSESTNYSLSGTSATYVDYTQAATTTVSESHTHPIYTDYTQAGAKDFSQKGANTEYENYEYKETQSNPYYAYYAQLAAANSHKRKPHYFGNRPIINKSHYQLSSKLFKGKTGNKIIDKNHENKWIDNQEYMEDSSLQLNNGPAHVHTEIENGATNNPSLKQINNYIQLARVCPVCFKTIYKQLTERLDPNDEAMLQLFHKILLYSYGQVQNQPKHFSHGTQSFQNHLSILDSQSNQQQQPVQTLLSDSLHKDQAINLQFEQVPSILSKTTIQNSQGSLKLKNQHSQLQKNIHNYQLPIDTAETMLEEGETESFSKAHMARFPKIQLFNEENLRNVLSAIKNHMKTRQDKYTFKLYAILKLLFDVGKAYTSDGNDASWYGQLSSNTRNSILRYLYDLVKLPWLQEVMLQLYESNNNLDILKNPIWRSHLAAWHTPDVLLNTNDEFDKLYSNYEYNNNNNDYQEVFVNSQDDESTIVAILKSYIHSPEYNLSIGSSESYQKQNKVLGQVVMYLKQRGYEMNFIEKVINKLHDALNRHVRKVRSSGTPELKN